MPTTPPNNTPKISIDPAGLRRLVDVGTQNIHNIPGSSPYMRLDAGSRLESNEAFVRGNNQSWGEQLGYATLRFIPSVIGKTLTGAAALGETIYYSMFGDDAAFSPEVYEKVYAENSLTTAFNSFEKAIEEALPIYQSEKYLTSNTARKFWTTSFFATDLADGLEFLASAIIPGTQITKLGSASGLVTRLITKAGLPVSAASKVEAITNFARNVAGVEEGLTGLIANTVYSTATESLIEGKDTFDTLKGVLKEVHPDWTEEQIKQEAAVHASYTVRYNMMALAFSNFIESKWIFGNPSIKGIRKAVRSGKDAGIKLNLVNNILKGTFVEGLWEEDIQTAIQRYEEKIARGIYSRDSKKIAGEMAVNLLGFGRSLPELISFGLIKTGAMPHTEQDEGSLSTLLGALLGSGMAVYSSVSDYKTLKDVEQKEKDLWNKILNNVDIANAQHVENRKNPYKKNEDDSLKLDEDGNPIKDLEAIQNEIQDVNRRSNFLINAIKAALNGDSLYDFHNKAKSLAAYVYKLRSSGLTHEDMLDAIKYKLKDALTDEDAKTLGIENELKDYRDSIAKMSELYDQAEDDIQDDTSISKKEVDQHFNNFKRRAFYYYKSMDYILGREHDMAPTDKIKKGINELKEDFAKQYEVLSTSKSKLKGIFREAVAPVVKKVEKLKDLRSKLKDAKDESEKQAINDEIEAISFGIAEEVNSTGTRLDTKSDAKGESKDHLGAMTYVPTSVMPLVEPRLLNSATGAAPGLISEAQAALGRSVIVGSHLSKLDNDIDETFNKASALSSDDKSINEFKEGIRQALTNFFSNALPSINRGAKYTRDIADQIEGIKKKLNDKIDNIKEQIKKSYPPDILEFAEVPEEKKIRALEEALRTLEQTEKQLEDKEKELDEITNAYLNREKTGDYLELVLKKRLTAAIKQMIESSTYVDANGNRQPDVNRLPDLETIDKAIKHVKAGIQYYQDHSEANFKDDPNFKQRSIEYLQSLLDQLQKMRKMAASASEQREKEQLRSERDFVKNVINAIGKFLSGEILGRLKTELSKLGVEGDTASLGHLMRALINLKKDNPKLVNDINKVVKEVLDKLPPKYGSASTKVENRLVELAILKALEASKEHIQGGNYNNIVSRIRALAETNDLLTLEDYINNELGPSNINKEGLKILRSGLTEAKENLGLTFIRDFFNANLSPETVVKALDKIEGGIPIRPTVQQTIAILQSLFTIYNSKAKSIYDNIPTVIGSAGAGKTSGVIKWVISLVKEISNINDNEIAYGGHSDLSTKVLTDHNPGGVAVSISELLNNTDESLKKLEKAKLIVLDEVYAVWGDSLTQALELIRQSNPKAKILLSGDPHQYSSVNNLSNGTTGNKIHIVYPLTVNYRTSIYPIIQASSAFRARYDTPDEITTTGNVNQEVLKNNPDNAIGVFNLKEPEIIEMLKKPANGSRLLIVDDETQKNKYQGMVDGSVTVATIDEVNGVTFDQVYVLLSSKVKNDNTINSVEGMQNNKKMYTAITRAAKAAIVDFGRFGTKTKASIDPSINDNTSISQKELDSIAKKFKEFLRDIKGLKPEEDNKGDNKEEDNNQPPTPDKKTPNKQQREPEKDDNTEDDDLEDEDNKNPSQDENPEKDPSESDKPQDGNRGPKETVDKDGSLSHKLLYVNNHLIAVGQHVGNISDDVSWNEAHLIKGIMENSDGTYTPVMAVVVPSKGTQNGYYTVSVLSNEDLEGTELGKAIYSKLNIGSYNDFVNHINTSGSVVKIKSGRRVSVIGKSALDNAKIFPIKVKSKSPLQVHYTSDESKFTGIAEGLKKFLLDILPPKAAKKIETKDAATILKEYTSGNDPKVRFKIYTKEEASKIPSRYGFKVKPGVPYMVIKNIHGNNYSNVLHLEMQPNKLNQHKNNVHYQTLNDFVNKIDNMLALGYNINTIYHKIEQAAKYFKYNKDTKQLELANPLGFREAFNNKPEEPALLESLVKLVYGPKERVVYENASKIDEMMQNDPGIIDFIPASNKLNKKKIEIYNKAKERAKGDEKLLPKTLEDYRKLGLEIKDTDKVKFKKVADAESTDYTLLSEIQPTKNQGKLQKTLNALAKSNKQIAHRIEFRGKSGNIKSVRVAPPAISTSKYELRVSKNYFKELRELQQEVLRPFTNAIAEARGVDSSDVKINATVEKLESLIYSIYSDTSKLTISEEAAKKILKNYEDNKERIRKRHSVKTLEYAQIKDLLDTAYLPISRNPGNENEESSILIPHGVNDVSEALHSRFDSASPAQVTITTGKENRVKGTKASKPSEDKTKPNKEPAKKDYPKGLPDNFKKLWDQSKNKKTISGKEFIKELLNSGKLTKLQKDIVNLILNSDKIGNVSVNMSNISAGKTVGATVVSKKGNTAIISIITDGLNSRKASTIAVHELIHSVTLPALKRVENAPETATEEDKRFHKAVTTILEEAKKEAIKRGDNPNDVLFQDTISEKNASEFIASMSNQKVWNYLKGLGNGILERIFKALGEYIFGTKSKNAAAVLYQVFEEHVKKTSAPHQAQKTDFKPKNFHTVSDYNQNKDNMDTHEIQANESFINSRKRTMAKKINGYFKETSKEHITIVIPDVNDTNAMNKGIITLRSVISENPDIKDKITFVIPDKYSSLLNTNYAATLEDLGFINKKCK